MKTLPFFSGLVALGNIVSAVHLGINGRRRSLQSSALSRRGSISGGQSGLTDSVDIQYNTNITLGGQSFSVLIDTGSADLWVAATSIPGATDTGQTSGVTYAVGQVTGPIQLGHLNFAGYDVTEQAFLLVPPNSGQGSGLIGLGPSAGSNILNTLASSKGNTPLDNIFLQDTSTPNYLTVLLGRSADPTDRFPGDLTVGEILPGYEDIGNQPKLPVAAVSAQDTPNQHWQTLLDANGVTGPDGKSITITSMVTGAKNPQQATVVFDSGFSLPQVPKSVADAFYSGFTGAEYTDVSGLGSVWILPCTSEVNVTFKFAGVTFPIHPLDATLDPSDLGMDGLKNSQGTPACIGAFQPISFDSQGLFDMILGMAFLRNAYLYVNFGDFIQGTTNTAAPYVQLLSITNNSAEAHNDFVAVRLNGSMPNDLHSPPSGNGGNGSGSGGGGKSNPIHIKIPYYAIALAFGGLAVLVVGLAFCLRRRRLNRGRYVPVGAPAPAAAMEMQPSWHQNQQYQQSYNQHYNQQYGDAWNPRY